MIGRRAFVLAAPALLAGCDFFRGMMGPQDETEQVRALAGFVASEDRLIFMGDVTPGADAQLQALLEGAPEITTLELDGVAGPQGSPEAIALGRSVRNAGLATEVRQGARVAGAGTDVFLAGVPRTVEEGATLAWRGRNMENAPEYAAYLDEMSGTGAVTTYLDSEAPRLRNRALSTLDIQRLGLATNGITGPFADIGREMN